MQHEPEFVVAKRSQVRAWIDGKQTLTGGDLAFLHALRGALDIAQAEARDGCPATVEIIVVEDADHVPRIT